MVRKSLAFIVLIIVGMSATCDADKWKIVPGVLKHASVSINYIAGVNNEDQIYVCKQPCTGSFHEVGGRLMQLDINDIEMWGVNAAHDIYKRPADGSGSWIKVDGKLKHVSASGNGYVWGVNSKDDIYVCQKPCSGSWKYVPGKLMQIDGGDRYVFGVSSINEVFRRPVNGSGVWKGIGNKKMKYVSVGSDKVYGIDTDCVLFSCELPCDDGKWVEVEFSECYDLDQVEASVDSLAGTSSGIILKKGLI